MLLSAQPLNVSPICLCSPHHDCHQCYHVTGDTESTLYVMFEDSPAYAKYQTSK